MDDLTVIFLTQNQLPERWAKFQLHVLCEAIDGASVISVSRKSTCHFPGSPRKFIWNFLQENEQSHWNVYRQMNRAMRFVQTPYVAIAEDDTLYPREHFTEYRPTKAVAYDMARWSLLLWDTSCFSRRYKRGNFSLIADSETLRAALQERMIKYPEDIHPRLAAEVGRHAIEERLGLSCPTVTDWMCSRPMVNVCHQMGLSPPRSNGSTKHHTKIRKDMIVPWGTPEDIKQLWTT